MLALYFRDLKLGVRAGGGALTGVLFFLAVIATIPFGVGPDLNLLARIGPAILWIGALLASLLGLLMNMEIVGIGATTLTLLVGTPAIAFIGAAGAAVAVALPRGGLLISVLVLPLVVPVLIFGVSASYGAVNEPDPFLPPFLMLCALTLFMGVMGPLAAAAALRWSGD